VPPTGFGFCELSSMHNEPVFANFAVFNVQPRFSVVLPLAEDAEDLQAFRDREAEPVMSYEALLQDLQANGKL
jgi:hypothetical protein